MKIKESYIEKDNNILDLKENSRIEYLESDNKYNVYIEYITDINYQLDYNNPYKYYIYVDDELQTEVERTIDYVDRMRSDEDRKCYTFRAFYNKRGEIFYKACIYGIHSFYIYFILIIIFCMYMSLYGKRKKAGMLCGGIVKEEDVNLNREDFEKFELEKAYASLYYCTQISTKKLKNGIIGAYILKWYNCNNINITNKGNKVYILNLKDGNFLKSKLEQELYDLLKEAAGDNNTIDNTEFRKWSRLNKDRIKSWHEDLLKYGYNDNLRQDAKRLLGLKKFLLDYSLMEEKQHIEVKTWGNYLIYAQLLGISDKVNKQFSKIYPDYSKIGELAVMNFQALTIEFALFQLGWILIGCLAMFPSLITTFIIYSFMLGA